MEVLSPAVCDNDPIVSVIVPCFKQARFLPECLQTLQAQSLRDWEMVIVNDGSPDDALIVAAGPIQADARVRLVDRPNGGPSAARNAGLRASRGRYIQFLDADDLFAPAKLARHAALLDRDSTLALVYGNAWYFDDADPGRRVRQGFGPNPHDDWIARMAGPPGTALHRALKHNLMPICSPLFRRTLAEMAGPMDETMRALEDWEYWIRCANACDRFLFDPSPEAESFIRLHPSSASQDRGFMTRAVLGMRLQCMSYLRDRKARRVMMSYIGRSLSARPDVSRADTYAQLGTVARGAEEHIAVWLARHVGPQSMAHAQLVPLIKLLPWHFRSLALD